jgi:hypothetical protein
MRTPRFSLFTIMICTVILLSVAPLSVTGQGHSGYKGRYLSGSINMLVNTFPASPVNMVIARAEGLSVTPEINPSLELEVALFRRVGIGFHAARRTLGVPYKHDIIWTYKPNSAADFVTETVPAGAFPYKWNRLGIDFLFYSSGFQAPYGRYIKLSLSRTSLTLKNSQKYLEPFQRNFELQENLTFFMPSIGFGRKFLVSERAWIGIGGQYIPDFQKIKYMFYDHFLEFGIISFEKAPLYKDTDVMLSGTWSKGVGNKSDNSAELRILAHQMLRLSLSMSVGIFF